MAGRVSPSALPSLVWAAQHPSVQRRAGAPQSLSTQPRVHMLDPTDEAVGSVLVALGKEEGIERCVVSGGDFRLKGARSLVRLELSQHNLLLD